MKRGRGNSQKLLARVRCGNMESYNKYWEKVARKEFAGYVNSCRVGNIETLVERM